MPAGEVVTITADGGSRHGWGMSTQPHDRNDWIDEPTLPGGRSHLWAWLLLAAIVAGSVYLLAFGFARGHLSLSTLWPARWGLVAPLNRTVSA